MKCSKIEIVNETPAPTGLAKIFAAVMGKNGALPEIDGNNYFTGEVPAGKAAHGGQYGLAADNQKDWEMMWEMVGVAAPGKLPKGAQAVMFADMYTRDGNSSTSVVKATIKGSVVHSEWLVERAPAAEGEARRAGFAVILLPGDLRVTERFTYADASAAAKQPPAPGV